VRRVERGESTVTVKVIEKLAAAHGMAPNDYMNALAEVARQQKQSD
jgi:protein-disulfide isomerase-like protein with CxxC motif